MVVWTKRTDGSTVWSWRTTNVAPGTVEWTTATRPSNPFNGQTGWNTDHPGLESYDELRSGWVILSGSWTVATRPTTADILAGSVGYNTDAGYGLEQWDGTNWRIL